MVLWLSVQSTMFVYAGSGDAEAVRWFRLAAEQGYADAQYDLGLMYAEGRGVVEDDAEGVVWLRKAGDQGHAEAQFSLAKCSSWAKVSPGIWTKRHAGIDWPGSRE